MKRIILMFTLLATFLFILGINNTVTFSAENKINQKIAPLTPKDFGIDVFSIGEPIKESKILDVFGDPIRLYEEDDGKCYQYLGFYMQTSSKKGEEILSLVGITGKSVKTRRGITVDDPEIIITKKYGKPSYFNKEHKAYTYSIPVKNNKYYLGSKHFYIISFFIEEINGLICNIDIRIE